MRRFKYIILLLSVYLVLGLHSEAQISYKPKEVHMTLDYSLPQKGVNVSGPAFGVSWLMQNRFINTFDFAVANKRQIQSPLVDRAVTLRYQFLYMPENPLGKLQTGIGLGIDRRIAKNGHLGVNMLGKIKYPFYQTYFVELIVPYNLYYKSYGDYGMNSESKGETFKTFKGIDLKTKRLSTVRVGVGVSF